MLVWWIFVNKIWPTSIGQGDVGFELCILWICIYTSNAIYYFVKASNNQYMYGKLPIHNTLYISVELIQLNSDDMICSYP